ncbi:hypothetical protein TB1_011881 [Malus domestica]
MFASGISVGDVSWPTSAQLPGRLAPVEGYCRASASLSSFVEQGSLGKACRARLIRHGLSGKAGRARLVRHGLLGKAGREGQR